jgi:cyclic beta-1,2-glucan synthetase
VSLFCRLYAGDTAIDIYSRAVSDLYQDLFGSGIFVGKGIYNVGEFQRSLANRVPDDAILSHNLLEGTHGRTALASNIVLYKNLPSNYPEYALRLHRWTRGGWTILPGSAWLWTLLAVATPDLYLMIELLNIFSLALRRQLFFDVLTRFSERSGRWFLAITFLISDAVLSIDAIARTLWRLTVSRKRLLQ